MELIAFLILCAWVIFATWDLRRALIFLPALFPFYMVKFYALGIPFNVVEVIVYVTFLIYVIRNWQERFFNGARFSFLKKMVVGLFREDRSMWVQLNKKFFRFGLPVIGLFLSSLAGLYVSYLGGDFVSALGIFKGWVCMPLFYAMLFIVVLKDVRDKRLTLNFYMLSVVGLSLWALYQVVTGDYITIDQRASGPFQSANYLALYIAPAVVLSALFLWQKIEEHIWRGNDEGGVFGAVLGRIKSLFKKEDEYSYLWTSFEVFVFVLSSLALVFSKSYGGILGVLAGLVVYAVYEIFFSDFRSKYGKLWIKIIVFVGILLMVGAAVLAQVGTTKFDDFLKFDQQSSSSVRIQVWTVSLKLIEESPFLGVGLGEFQRIYEDRAEELLEVEPYEETMLHPHNLMISTWLNTGLIGAFSMAWLIVAVYWGIRNRELSYDEKRFIAVVLSMFVVICIHGLVDQPFWKNDLALLWWMVVAAVI